MDNRSEIVSELYGFVQRGVIHKWLTDRADEGGCNLGLLTLQEVVLR